MAREVCTRVMYKGEELGTQRLDMVVDEKLVVETKSTYELHKAATRQLYNYLRGTNLEIGLLLHFGPAPKAHRVVCRNGLAVTNTKSPNPPDPTHPEYPAEPSS